MILWVDGAHDAPVNMARDAELLARADSLPGPVVRLFTFAPAGITLGRAQDPRRELDLASLERDGVAWARRPTGGRAIWHEQEWTFSLVTPLGPGGWAATPAEAYARTGDLFARALRALGVPVELAPGTPGGPGAPRGTTGAAPPCFASTARFELVIGDRKLAGIAQRVAGGVLLQQGSLLLGESHVRLAVYAAVPDGTRAALADRLVAGACSAGRYLGADQSLDRLAAALVPVLAPTEVVAGETGARRLALATAPRAAGGLPR